MADLRHLLYKKTIARIAEPNPNKNSPIYFFIIASRLFIYVLYLILYHIRNNIFLSHCHYGVYGDFVVILMVLLNSIYNIEEVTKWHHLKSGLVEMLEL